MSCGTSCANHGWFCHLARIVPSLGPDKIHDDKENVDDEDLDASDMEAGDEIHKRIEFIFDSLLKSRGDSQNEQ